MIEIKNIRKTFGKQEVLKGVSARFETGKTNLIIGISGSGKTVLMKCMVGLVKPESGEILYDGKNFIDIESQQRKNIQKEIGMLFQGSALFDSMTVEENVMLPLNMFSKQTKKEKLHRVNECLERVNLSDTNNKYPGEISGGMKKRVGIARAIVLNPVYLFCDEPNSGLDPKTSLIIDNLISEITKEYNITTIINTHDMNSVMEIGEKIIFLHEGEKEWEGTNREILSAQDENLNSFIFASEFLKEARQSIYEKRNI